MIFSISTMAAAALGNIISDVAGVGLAHYVEILVSRIGFKHPEMNSKQVRLFFIYTYFKILIFFVWGQNKF